MLPSPPSDAKPENARKTAPFAVTEWTDQNERNDQTDEIDLVKRVNRISPMKIKVMFASRTRGLRITRKKSTDLIKTHRTMRVLVRFSDDPEN